MDKFAFEHLMLENRQLLQKTQTILKYMRSLLDDAHRFNLQAKDVIENSSKWLSQPPAKEDEHTLIFRLWRS